MKNSIKSYEDYYICIHFCQKQYSPMIQCSIKFRMIIDMTVKEHPELFPPEISYAYKMKEIRVSKKLNFGIVLKHHLAGTASWKPLLNQQKDYRNTFLLMKSTLGFWGIRPTLLLPPEMAVF